MRYRRKRRAGNPRFFTITALALALPVTVNFCLNHRVFFEQVGESAAILSAALTMPDTGIVLLEERFRGEIYGDESLPDSKPNQGTQIPGSPSPAPDAESGNDGDQQDPGSTQNETGPGEDSRIQAPKVPAKYAAPLLSENFAGYDDGDFIAYKTGYIKNSTTYSDEAVLEILKEPYAIEFEATDAPQVLIVHTHATESFEKYDTTQYDVRNTWRSTDNHNNMVAVGNAMEEVLSQNGIGVIHDTTQHDYPSYNGAYERSAKTINEYLDEFPSIKVVLDLHRDGIIRDDDSIVKPVATIDGRKAAQIMIIAGCDDGSMDMPKWRQNLRFAAAYQDYMEQYYPELTRPIFFCYRKYNMDLSTGSLLLEFGSNANTLDEAIYSAQLAGQALSQMILDTLPEEEDEEDAWAGEEDELLEVMEAEVDEGGEELPGEDGGQEE